MRSPLPQLLMETFGATAGCTVCLSVRTSSQTVHWSSHVHCTDVDARSRTESSSKDPGVAWGVPGTIARAGGWGWDGPPSDGGATRGRARGDRGNEASAAAQVCKRRDGGEGCLERSPGATAAKY